MRKCHKWTVEQIEWLKNNCKGKRLKEITADFNRTFNTELSVTAVAAKKDSLKIKTGLTGYFPKGNVPFNKGKKWDDYMTEDSKNKSLATTFKKGIIPPNTHPIGTEVTDSDGYILIKVAETNKWEYRSRFVYKTNFGEIPKGYAILHRDKNKANDNPDNLIAVSRQELARLNQDGLLSDVPEISDIAINLVKLKLKIREREKEKCKGNNIKN